MEHYVPESSLVLTRRIFEESIQFSSSRLGDESFREDKNHQGGLSDARLAIPFQDRSAVIEQLRAIDIGLKRYRELLTSAADKEAAKKRGENSALFNGVHH